MIRKYAEIFCWKNVSSFCIAKATHIFSAKNIRILYIESAKTVNKMTLNKLVKLTTLWTTGPWKISPSVYLTTPFLDRLSPLSDWPVSVHILSSETDNCPSWISRGEKMTIENISWSIRECYLAWRGSNPQPPDHQLNMHLTEPPWPAVSIEKESTYYHVVISLTGVSILHKYPF